MIVIFLHALSLAATPLLSFGPFKIFVLSQALQHGWQRALRLALTPLVADVPVILTVWLLLRQFPREAIHVLQIAGGLFFVYLATVLYRKAGVTAVPADGLARAPDHPFRLAVIAIWINPHIYVNWGLIGVPAVLNYAEQSLWFALQFLLCFYLVWIGGLALQIIIVGRLGSINPRANRMVVTMASTLLVGFGLYQVWAGASILLRQGIGRA